MVRKLNVSVRRQVSGDESGGGDGRLQGAAEAEEDAPTDAGARHDQVRAFYYIQEGFCRNDTSIFNFFLLARNE